MSTGIFKTFGEAYGLTITSDIALPDLAKRNPAPVADITIVRGPVERWNRDDPHALSEFLRARGDRLWLNIPGKLKMRMESGRRITYQPYEGCIEDELRLFLLGSGLGAIMMQRGHIVLHANAIAMPDGEAIVCLGRSGAGKSTTAAAMMVCGYEVLTDDVCVIGQSGRIERGVPRLKLWDEAARRLAIDTSGLHRFKGAHDKWNLPLAPLASDAVQRASMAILLEVGAVDALQVTALTGIERFTAFRNNVYRPECCTALNLETDYMERLAQLAASIPVFRVVRPDEGFTIEPLVATILGLHRTVSSAQGPLTEPDLVSISGVEG